MVNEACTDHDGLGPWRRRRRVRRWRGRRSLLGRGRFGGRSGGTWRGTQGDGHRRPRRRRRRRPARAPEQALLVRQILLMRGKPLIRSCGSPP